MGIIDLAFLAAIVYHQLLVARERDEKIARDRLEWRESCKVRSVSDTSTPPTQPGS